MSLKLGAPQNWEELEQSFAALQTWLDRGILDVRGYGSFAAQPRCRHTTPSAQTISNNTDTTITWSSASVSGVPEYEYDNGDEHGQAFLSANGTDVRIPPLPGLYDIRVSINWDANTTGRRELWFFLKTYQYTVQLAADSRPANPSSGVTQSCSGIAIVTTPPAGSNWPIVYAQCYQNSGGNLDINSDYTVTWIQITKIA
jgi:hypothetical protein